MRWFEAERLHVTPGTLIPLIDRLEAQGYLHHGAQVAPPGCELVADDLEAEAQSVSLIFRLLVWCPWRYGSGHWHRHPHEHPHWAGTT